MFLGVKGKVVCVAEIKCLLLFVECISSQVSRNLDLYCILNIVHRH